ncbi:MAG: hypothetical protein IBX69_06820 [Anaerolineales bacterium]|nr:hypothetical protein [Anaerolineales bacterium]
MHPIDRINHYKTLLKIRRKARLRDSIIIGGLFIVSLLAMIATGLVTSLGSREVYLVAGINIVLGMSFLMAWTRLEILRESIDLLENLPTGMGSKFTDANSGELP